MDERNVTYASDRLIRTSLNHGSERAGRRRFSISRELLAAVAALAAALATLMAPSVTEARVVAHAMISRSHGGIVRADGAELYVPRGALNESHAVATISRLGPGRFGFAIRGEWHGRVRVSLPAPPKGWVPVVLHTVHGANHLESRRVGQLTVWVDHLSTFDSGVPQECLDVLYDAAEGGPEAAGGGFAACLAGYTIVNLTVLGAEELAQLTGGHGGSGSPGTSTGPGGDLPVGQGAPVTIQGSSPTLQGGGPTPVPAPAPEPSPAPPPPPPPTEAAEGFVIEDSIYGGTWARTDPDDGSWYPRSSAPPNGAYWYPNGLGVAVSCAESAAPYTAVIYGAAQTWTWWAHVTDGKWVPTVVFSSVWSDGLPAGLPEC